MHDSDAVLRAKESPATLPPQGLIHGRANKAHSEPFAVKPLAGVGRGRLRPHGCFQ